MKTLFFISVTTLILLCCKNPANKAIIIDTKSKNLENNNDEKIKDEKKYAKKCIILFLPDSLELIDVEKQKTSEELTAIEYDKTDVISFLQEKGIEVEVEDNRFFKFTKNNGKSVTIDKTNFSNWGLILFNPEKDPKVIPLNEIYEEYSIYFEN